MPIPIFWPIQSWSSTKFVYPSRPTPASGPVVTQIGETPSCCCNQPIQAPQGLPKVARKSAKSAGSLLVSLLIAFFPKCPICWAAYMSMFGSLSLSNLAYQAWLYPVLLIFLAIHLLLLFRRRRIKGYGPFLVSVFGALILVVARSFNLDIKWLLYLGMSSILIGSLWNSFKFSRKTNSLII